MNRTDRLLAIVLVTLSVRHQNEVIQWLLGWGRYVRVLEPPSVRQRVLEEAQEMIRKHEA